MESNFIVSALLLVINKGRGMYWDLAKLQLKSHGFSVDDYPIRSHKFKPMALAEIKRQSQSTRHYHQLVAMVSIYSMILMRIFEAKRVGASEALINSVKSINPVVKGRLESGFIESLGLAMLIEVAVSLNIELDFTTIINKGSFYEN